MNKRNILECDVFTNLYRVPSLSYPKQTTKKYTTHADNSIQHKRDHSHMRKTPACKENVRASDHRLHLATPLRDYPVCRLMPWRADQRLPNSGRFTASTKMLMHWAYCIDTLHEYCNTTVNHVHEIILFELHIMSASLFALRNLATKIQQVKLHPAPFRQGNAMSINGKWCGCIQSVTNGTEIITTTTK